MKKPFYAWFQLAILLILTLPVHAQIGRASYEETGFSQARTGESSPQLISRYSRHLRLNPRSGTTYNNRASAYFSAGQYEQAIEDYTKALKYYDSPSASRLARIYYKRGLCFYILQEYDYAVKDFSAAIGYRSDIPDSWYFRGKIRKMVFRQRNLAHRDLQEVLRLTNSNSIQSAFAKLLMNETQSAVRVTKNILHASGSSNRKDHAAILYNVAGLYGLIGDTENAVHYLEKAFQMGYRTYHWLERDINFIPISHTHSFQALLAKRGIRYQLGQGAASAPRQTPDREWPEVTQTPQQGQDDDWGGYWDIFEDVEPDLNPSGRPSSPTRLSGQGLSFEDVNGNNQIDAGESTYIVFRLENEGPGYAEELQVQVSETSGLRGLEFQAERQLGTLPPNRYQDVKIRVTGGNQLETGQAEFEIQVREKFGFDAGVLRISIPTLAYQPPALEVVDHQFGSHSGGRMQLGVPITVKFAVQNTGRGTAENVQVQMMLPQNVFPAADDMFQLGSLSAGESRIIDFEFFTNRRYDREMVPIKAVIKDQTGQYGSEKVMSVSINQQLELADRVVINAAPIEAEDIQEIQLTSDVDMGLPRAIRRRENAIAVIIGNRDYENRDVPPVDFALQDAASMRKYLVESFGFMEENIIFVPNATQADFNGIFGTKGDHKARLYNLVKPEESEVFIFYSGHGSPDLSTEEGYFVPVDCDPTLVRFNGYAINTLYENLAKIPYKQLTVVIDACFSGTSDKGTLIPAASLVRIKSETGVLSDPNAMVFTSATGTQIASWYPAQRHSLFTYYFLKGLQGAANANRDRQLTLYELKSYLYEEVPSMARRLKNRTQTPEVYGRDSRVILSY
ncbi:caspase family protein [Pontibacter sp. G13]|uniref:caspase family protein n=1 Tax=Pontibacter sp. G13 TaxID=3074898 RepID=UPI00288A12AC|nr:caspase family protein [Pontibacter sp. G13]WNJ20634.1 caspase family protein [Pontibacter sp. G13]